MIDRVIYKIESHFPNTYRELYVQLIRIRKVRLNLVRNSIDHCGYCRLYKSIEDSLNLTHVAEHLSKAIDSNSHLTLTKLPQNLKNNGIVP